MPGLMSDSGEPATNAIVPISPDPLLKYPIHHGLKPPISRLSVSWSRGNSLRFTVLIQAQQSTNGDEDAAGGSVVEVKLTKNLDSEVEDLQWRRIAYGSVAPFALLQSRKSSIATLSKMSSLEDTDWWHYIMEYSKEINTLLADPNSTPTVAIEDPTTVLKEAKKPTTLKAAWELMEIFYADKQSQAWIPERLVDWLADYDCLFSGVQPTVHSKLVAFQKELVTIQPYSIFAQVLIDYKAVEDDPRYWEALSSALSVGWLEIVVKLLRLHGSYQYDHMASHETENGLVEAVAVLVSKMPRMRPDSEAEILGECYKNKPDFMKAWEKWRAQLTKLDCSAFWLQCGHRQTRDRLKNLLQILLGNSSALSGSTFHWLEYYIAHFLYIRPFTVGIESMYSLAQKCMQIKPDSGTHKLTRLLIGILGENPEVVLAECSRSFGPWMMVHAIELLTFGSVQADLVLNEERPNLGNICIEELNRLVYAQALSSHALTWQIAPVYLASCMKQGLGLLETLLNKQPVQHHQVLLKSIEICRLYALETVSSNIMRIRGVHDWKHGKRGSGIYWLQQAKDEFRLSRIAKTLFDVVGKSVSDANLEQWEGLIELLGSESGATGGLDFLNKYRDFRRLLHQVHGKMVGDAAQKTAEALILLMKSPSTPQRFWLPILYDSLTLLNWRERPLLNVSETNLLLNKLQELSMARLRPDFVESSLPPDAVTSIRLAIATNLGRAILEE